MRHSWKFVLGVFTLLALAGCGKGSPTSPLPFVPLRSLTVSPTPDTILVGGSVQLQVVAIDTSGAAVATPSVAWRSTNTAVARVTGGHVSGVGEGTALVIASSGGQSDTATVVVLPAARGWFADVSNTSVNLNGVGFAHDGSIGWAVGSGGRILVTTDMGGTWSVQVPPTAFILNAVWVSSATEAWVAGAAGTILHTTNGGTTWVRLMSGSTSDLYDVTFATADTGFAVGSGGAVLRTTDHGATWTTTHPPTSFILRGVSFSGRDGWVVGDAGVILGTHDMGATWFVVQHVTGQPLRAVRRQSASAAVAVGAGTVLQTTVTPDSVAWQLLVSPGASDDLHGLFMANTLTGWAVGVNGTALIIRTDDGGATWTPQAANSQFRLNDVFFLDANRGWAVGNNGTILHTATGGQP